MSDRRLSKTMDELFPKQDEDKCRVCNEPVVNGRWNYCSERCREIANAVQSMFSWSFVREKVLDRDDYTCQNCGVTREKQMRAYHQTQEIIKERIQHLKEDGKMDEWRERERELSDEIGVEAPVDGFFHVDHITRVADGGHPFDESNLQTLCKHCHRSKTSEENSSSREQQSMTLSDYMD